jgi:hypothetical protein
MLFVDFKHPKNYKQTQPASCVINGTAVKIYGKSGWANLLAAITKRFISERNPAVEALRTSPLAAYADESQPFLMSSTVNTKKHICVAYRRSGGWINVDFSEQELVEKIGLLCTHCGVSLDNVKISYCEKAGAGDHASESTPIRTATDESLQQMKSAAAADENVMHILLTCFSNGFRLNSPIETARFRSFASKASNGVPAMSDEELTEAIITSGTVFDGKVYAVPASAKIRIKESAEEYFSGGARAIFFAEYYAKNEGLMFASNVVSADVLIGVLRNLFPELSFTQTYFGFTSTSISSVLEDEILRVWNRDVLLTYDRLAALLPYIPLSRIKYALGQHGDFIWNSAETFSHVSRIEITDYERETVQAAAVRECNARGYVSVVDLPFGEIGERNYELSVTAVHNAVYRICLSDNFDKRGKIITRKGNVFDALTIMKEYCRTVDRCSLDDLLEYEKELTGESHRWVPMEAGNAVLIRVDKEHYVADRYVHFIPDMIDDAIDRVVTGDYLPLKSFTTFVAFPDCGHTWNLFLLESYCRRFSRRFRFDAPSVNSRNAGAVIRRSCDMDYTQVMTDAVANAGVLLTEANVGRFLYDSGYTGKSTTAQAPKIIEKAKAYRERRN